MEARIEWVLRDNHLNSETDASISGNAGYDLNRLNQELFNASDNDVEESGEQYGLVDSLNKFDEILK